jgi:hypothetical protein
MSWMNLEINASYRYLKFKENIKGKDEPDATSFWTIKYDRDFSAYMIGGSISIPF